MTEKQLIGLLNRSLNTLDKLTKMSHETFEYYELLEHCLGSLEQVKSKGWSRTEPAPIF